MRFNKKVLLAASAVLLAAAGITGALLLHQPEKAPVVDPPAQEDVVFYATDYTAPPRDAMTLWYTKPASYTNEGWESHALPIGNGKIGAKIFGGVTQENIQLNEKTLWSGGPTVSGYSGGNGDGDYGETILKIQKLLEKGKEAKAAKAMNKLQGNETGLGAYQNFGEIQLQFPQSDAPCDGYIRDLNLQNATANVEFDRNGVSYQRSYFISYPDNVLVGKLSAGESGALNFDILIDSAQGAVPMAQGNRIVLTGMVNDLTETGEKGPNANNLRYASVLELVVTGGETKANSDGSITVNHADTVEFFFSAATDYANDYPVYRSENDPVLVAEQAVVAAVQKGYEEVYQSHLADYQELFQRVTLDVGQNIPCVPTDAQLADYAPGTPEGKALEVLYFQYGRYLLVASSRDGSLPANLQGIWNNSNTPPWQSDYHMNVNLQMNYWPAYVTGLAETALPLIDYVDSLREPGRVTAKLYTGIGGMLPNGCPDPYQPTGWMVHTQNSPMGNTGPGSNWKWGWAPTAGAWITQNTYDYYAFTKDVVMLSEKIYPAMEECALMWSQMLVYDSVTDRMVSSPSFSPEHGPVSAGNTFDQSILWQLYTNVIEGAQALESAGLASQVNHALIEKLRAQLPQLKPVRIGDWGQIKEWPLETNWNTGKKMADLGIEDQHRHMSHLLGLYPFHYITQDTPEYFEAARVSITQRGDGGTGWSKAQKICTWARLRDGNHSYKMLGELLKESTLANLWDTHPPFQIDGNFGAAAGMAEMLIQSQNGYIDFLPALPDAWKEQGSFSGLMARGNFVISLQWSQGKVLNVSIKAGTDADCILKLNPDQFAFVKNGTAILPVAGENGTVSIPMEAGQELVVNPV